MQLVSGFIFNMLREGAAEETDVMEMCEYWDLSDVLERGPWGFWYEKVSHM